MNTTQLKQLNELFEKNNLDLDLPQYYCGDLTCSQFPILNYEPVKNDTISNFDDLHFVLLEDSFLDVEIIYYSKAIKYLTENDQSLRISLELADDLGFELKDLNSELLASLLASHNLQESFFDLESEINLILNK